MHASPALRMSYDPDARIKELGIDLPKVAAAAANYVSIHFARILARTPYTHLHLHSCFVPGYFVLAHQNQFPQKCKWCVRAFAFINTC